MSGASFGGISESRFPRRHFVCADFRLNAPSAELRKGFVPALPGSVCMHGSRDFVLPCRWWPRERENGAESAQQFFHRRTNFKQDLKFPGDP